MAGIGGHLATQMCGFAHTSVPRIGIIRAPKKPVSLTLYQRCDVL